MIGILCSRIRVEEKALFEARCALQEFNEGRAMECDAVRRVLHDGLVNFHLLRTRNFTVVRLEPQRIGIVVVSSDGPIGIERT